MKWIPVHIAVGASVAYLLPEVAAQEFSSRYDVLVAYLFIVLLMDVVNTSEQNVKLLKGAGYFPNRSWWLPYRFHASAIFAVVCMYLSLHFKGSGVYILVTTGFCVVLALCGYFNRRVRQAWTYSAIKHNVRHRRAR